MAICSFYTLNSEKRAHGSVCVLLPLETFGSLLLLLQSQPSPVSQPATSTTTVFARSKFPSALRPPRPCNWRAVPKTENAAQAHTVDMRPLFGDCGGGDSARLDRPDATHTGQQPAAAAAASDDDDEADALQCAVRRCCCALAEIRRHLSSVAVIPSPSLRLAAKASFAHSKV